MLIPISQLPPDDYLRAVLRGHLVAVDPDSNAWLTVSHGHTSKAPKYILTVPNKSAAEDGGLWGPRTWDYPHGRKFLRAWSDTEAIELANAKLTKMLEARTV